MVTIEGGDVLVPGNGVGDHRHERAHFASGHHSGRGLALRRGRRGEGDRRRHAESRAAMISEYGVHLCRPGRGDAVSGDSAGNMVSLIQSSEIPGMGSGMTPTGCGFVLQDRGELFSLDGHANVYAPGKPAFRHHHSRFHHQGRQAVAFLRRDGWWNAAAGARADRRKPDRLRHEPAGSRDAPRARHDGSSEPTGGRRGRRRGGAGTAPHPRPRRRSRCAGTG